MAAKKSSKKKSAKKLRSISELFQDAWDLTRAKFKQLAVLTVVVTIGAILMTLALIVATGAALSQTGLFEMIASGDFSTIASLNPSSFVPAGAVATVGLLLFMAGSLLFGTAMTLTVASKKKLSLSESFSEATTLFWPLVGTSVLVFLLVLGSYFALFIPGLIVSLLLLFVNLEVMLGGRSYWDAIKRSVAVVSSHPWYILSRLVLLIVANVVLFAIVPEILISIAPGLEDVVGLVVSLASIVWNWFALAFFIELYRETSDATPAKKDVHIALLLGVSAIGWVILSSLLYGFISFVQSGGFEQMFSEVAKEIEAETAGQEYDYEYTDEELEMLFQDIREG